MNLATGNQRPILWLIGGADCSGGAGVYADLQACRKLGAYACTILTSVTAQNSKNLIASYPVSRKQFLSQWTALEEDLIPAVIKIGMLPNKEIIDAISERLNNERAFVVLDPVLKSSSGFDLMEYGALPSLRRLFAKVSVLTPNLPEAEALLGRPLKTPGDIESAALELRGFGAQSVIIKGGHGDQKWSQDHYLLNEGSGWISSPRLKTHARGTGCTFASSFATARAFGFSELDSLVIAKTHVNSAIRSSFEINSHM